MNVDTLLVCYKSLNRLHPCFTVIQFPHSFLVYLNIIFYFYFLIGFLIILFFGPQKLLQIIFEMLIHREIYS